MRNFKNKEYKKKCGCRKKLSKKISTASPCRPNIVELMKNTLSPISLKLRTRRFKRDLEKEKLKILIIFSLVGKI